MSLALVSVHCTVSGSAENRQPVRSDEGELDHTEDIHEMWTLRSKHAQNRIVSLRGARETQDSISLALRQVRPRRIL